MTQIQRKKLSKAELELEAKEKKLKKTTATAEAEKAERRERKNWFKLVEIKLENLKKEKAKKQEIKKVEEDIISLFKEELAYTDEEYQKKPSKKIPKKFEVIEKYLQNKEIVALPRVESFLDNEIELLHKDIDKRRDTIKKEEKKRKKIINWIQRMFLCIPLIVIIVGFCVASSDTMYVVLSILLLGLLFAHWLLSTIISSNLYTKELTEVAGFCRITTSLAKLNKFNIKEQQEEIDELKGNLKHNQMKR